MSQSNSIRDTFFEECQDLLEALDEGLNQIDEGERDSEVVNAVFRAVHSIKGGAGAFGLTELVAFAHTYETIFDEIRSDKLALEAPLIKTLFRGADHLVQLVEAARAETSYDESIHNAILEDLNEYLEDTGEEEEVEFEPMALDFSASIDVIEPLASVFSINFAPHEALYKNGHDPVFLIRALGELGNLNTRLDHADLPEIDKLDTTDAYLKWSISLETTNDESAVREVFEFVEGLCDLTIDQVQDTGEQIFQENTPSVVSEELSQTSNAANDQDTDLNSQAQKKEENISGIDPTPEQATGIKTKPPAPSLRVDPDRVDRLINTVGELIINQSMMAQRVSQLGQEQRRDIENDLEDYKLLARDIQEGVMAIRAQPVKPLFRRMARIAREAAHATEKLVRFDTSGENTEVDKTVIEGLVDPLTHMIRNAVDHGVETPEIRKAAGKDEIGVIQISASHRSGSVYIEINDDGAGLNRSKIFDIAAKKGLVSPTAELTESEIDNLLFLPGFSTASEVSNLSGRGVGMDVVKNAVISLGGRTSIASKTGHGTTFSIVLPLTLAVMDGMVITVADQTMVVPIASIVETIRAKPNELQNLDAEGRLLSIRGNFVPVIDVAKRLNIAVDCPEREQVYLLVETVAFGQTALAVDAIHDQRQVVVKSLEAAYGRVPGISAATILGDGKIAMILDPESIVQIAEATRSNEIRLAAKELEYASE
ncbi:MAG: chemotaxis protein CheA [Pseudomonadota bacterium]